MINASLIICNDKPDLEADCWDSIPTNLSEGEVLKLWYQPKAKKIFKWNDGEGWISAFEWIAPEEYSGEIELKDGLMIFKGGVLIDWKPKKDGDL